MKRKMKKMTAKIVPMKAPTIEPIMICKNAKSDEMYAEVEVGERWMRDTDVFVTCHQLGISNPFGEYCEISDWCLMGGIMPSRTYEEW